MKTENHNKKYRIWTWFGFIGAIVGLLFYSCLEEINLPLTENLQTSFVFQGRLIKGNPSILEASVGKIFDFTANNVRPVSAREIFVVDDEGNKLVLEAVSEGVYQLLIDENHPDFKVETGKNYQMQVNTFDGRLFVTNFEPLMPASTTSHLTLSIVDHDVEGVGGGFRTEDYILYSITSSLETAEVGEKARVRWEMERSYKLTDTPIDFGVEPKVCYITGYLGLEDVQVVNGNELTTGEVVDYPLLETPINYTYSEGQYFTVYQQSLSEGAFQYWDQVSQLVNRTGNMFEAPAGKLVSNFKNVEDPKDNVFGYFYATEQDTVRLYVSPDDVGNPSSICPPTVPAPPGRACAIQVCCNCLDETNSTAQKPSWWVE